MLDPTMPAIQSSLDGLAARQRIIAQNLANFETPGYLAQNVNFEDSLNAAMAAGNPSQAAITTSTSTDPTNPNGNSVNLDPQVVALMDTGLRFQQATQSMNKGFTIMRDSMRDTPTQPLRPTRPGRAIHEVQRWIDDHCHAS